MFGLAGVIPEGVVSTTTFTTITYVLTTLGRHCLWRIVTLHQIAVRYQQERARQEQARGQDIQKNLLPLVDSQAHHPRIRALSLGIHTQEPVIRTPQAVDWDRYLPQVAAIGLKLPGKTAEAPVV
jgi:hypothetical protein